MNAEKTCTKCLKCKELSNFSPDRRKKDGLQGQCKECRCSAEKLRYKAKSEDINKKRRDNRALNPFPYREYDNKRQRANPEKFREKNRKTYINNREKRKESAMRSYLADRENRIKKMREYDDTDPRRRMARYAVRKAIADNNLVKKPCEVCGHIKAEAHHDDYNKPLDVRWLCRSHHRLYHSKLRRKESAFTSGT